MNVPADNEHLQRFFMVLQSNAAAQNLQANIMAATLQSQATQIINNQILANQKAHHLHQVEQNYLKKKNENIFRCSNKVRACANLHHKREYQDEWSLVQKRPQSCRWDARSKPERFES